MLRIVLAHDVLPCIIKIFQTVHLKSQAVEAFKETIMIFNDQLAVNAEFVSRAQNFEKTKYVFKKIMNYIGVSLHFLAAPMIFGVCIV